MKVVFLPWTFPTELDCIKVEIGSQDGNMKLIKKRWYKKIW